jgi:hypothetical protein
MYVNRRTFAEITRAARRHWSLRRALTWAGFAVGVLLIRGVCWTAQRLDDLLWPGIAEQPIKRPVFLFANARSGTTLLHRLMSLDEERFVSLRLYQSIFGAVSIQRAVRALARFDRRIPGRPLHRIVDLINWVFFQGWKDIHEMGIDKPEEDEAIFALSLETPAIGLVLPYLDELQELQWFDEFDAEQRRDFLDLYEDALRRHLYVGGGDKVFLNKNVLFAPRVRSMLERFPDARFVYLIRHPCDALPSFLNMFYDTWATHSPEIAMDSPEVHALSRMAIAYLRYALDLRGHIPADQLKVVRYDDLIADPIATVAEIYQWLGHPLNETFHGVLEEATSREQGFVSRHRYTLEQFGLSRDAIYRELKDVYEEFGFQK